MGNNINWDVCPQWVRFQSKPVQAGDFSKDETLNLHEEECDHDHDHEHHPDRDGVTSEAIRLPNGDHYHKVIIKSGHHETERKTGPAIRTGRHQHFHIIQ